MIQLSTRHQIVIGLVLLALMVVTRGHHFATLNALPGATWAVFFLAGVYLSPTWVPFILLAAAGVLDYVSIAWFGTSSYCVSVAYGLLVPAYGALWFAGRRYAVVHRMGWRTLPALGGWLLAGAVVCELLSSGGFYLFSGRFAEPNLAEFGARTLRYFPPYLQSLGFYIGLAAFLHLVVVGLRRSAAARGQRDHLGA